MRVLIVLFFSLFVLSVCSKNSEIDAIKNKFIESYINTNFLSAKLSCTICSKVVGFLEGKIISKGCGFILKLEAAAACEAAGLGPEDPLSDVCAIALISACSEIAKLLANHIDNPTEICKKVHIC